MLKAVPVAAIASLALATPLLAQTPKASVSAPISHISYDVTFDATTAKQKSLKVSMQFSVIGPGDVLLSLPAWTPGAYEVTNFARWVSNFTPTAERQAARLGQAGLRHLADPRRPAPRR